MRLKEQKLYDAMKASAPCDVWLERVENLVGEGIPDVRVSFRGGSRDGWVELKAPSPRARALTPVLGAEGLRTSQKNWHRRAATHGTVSWILVRSGDSLFLVPGKFCDEVNGMDLAELREHSLAHNWPMVWAELRMACAGVYTEQGE